MLLEDGDHGVVGVDALRDGGRAGLGADVSSVSAPIAAAAALVLPVRPPPTSTAATATSARATFKVSNTV